VLEKGRDAVISIILDGENAWEYYPKSGREFLRRFYDGLQKDPGVEAVTISEAIARHKDFGKMTSLVPGSWINANFNVWIGAPEDNKAWDYLYAARQYYEQAAPNASDAQRMLAFEELLIAEGSDWNWWYGPEHHSANDRDFDELYRKHLSNVYHALGGVPPDYLAQPIIGGVVRPDFVQQTGYIHPRVDGSLQRYFEWIGAAMYTSDRRSGSMHGKQFVLDAVHAGVNDQYVYGRLDFIEAIPEHDFDLVVNVESRTPGNSTLRSLRIDATVKDRIIREWNISHQSTGEKIADSSGNALEPLVALRRVFEFRLPLAWLNVAPQEGSHAPHVRVRFSLWQDRLPVDALPLEGWVELLVVSETELEALAIS
jgi:hypothetical protein